MWGVDYTSTSKRVWFRLGAAGRRRARTPHVGADRRRRRPGARCRRPCVSTRTASCPGPTTPPPGCSGARAATSWSAGGGCRSASRTRWRPSSPRRRPRGGRGPTRCCCPTAARGGSRSVTSAPPAGRTGCRAPSSCWSTTACGRCWPTSPAAPGPPADGVHPARGPVRAVARGTGPARARRPPAADGGLGARGARRRRGLRRAGVRRRRRARGPGARRAAAAGPAGARRRPRTASPRGSPAT